jgi:hypothetical protein
MAGLVHVEQGHALLCPTERRSFLIALILLACCPCASALNPSFDINQYAHSAWTTHEGPFKGLINAIVQTPDGYPGSARNSVCFEQAIAEGRDPIQDLRSGRSERSCTVADSDGSRTG